MYDKPIAIFFSLLIFGQAYAMRLLAGTWLIPACLFGLAWFAFTFIPLVALFAVPVNPWSVAFILVCCIAFSTAALLWYWRPIFRWRVKNQNAATVYGSRFLRRAFYICSLSSVTFALLDWFEQGFSVNDLLFNIQASAFRYAQALYGETMTQGMNEKVSLVTSYLAAILGGLTISSARKKWVVVLLSFFPALFIGVTQTNKGLLLLCIAFFCAGLWVYRLASGNARIINKDSMKKLALSVSLLVPLMLSGFILRHPVEYADEVTPILAHYSASYCCGHLYAFSDWFSAVTGTRHSTTVYTNERAPSGFFTFMAVFHAFGSTKEMPMGVYDDFFTHEDLLITNIYTLFRGLIMDFGLFGALVFMGFTGLLFHQAFATMLLKKQPTFVVAVFVFMVAYFFISMGTSPFNSNRIAVAFVVLWGILYANRAGSNHARRCSQSSRTMPPLR